MIVRFVFPWDEFRQWAENGYRDGLIPLVRRARRRGRDLSHQLPDLPWKLVIPVAVALLAFANARSVFSPTAVGQSYAAHDSFVLLRGTNPLPIEHREYAWLDAAQKNISDALDERIGTDSGWRRLSLPVGSFGDWLRHLPMQRADVPVRDFRKRELNSVEQSGCAGVVALQPNTNKLGPAAMMVRLRAEYLWATQKSSAASFHFNTGQRMDWGDWSRGMRASLETGHLRFIQMAEADRSRSSFCAYLESLFVHTSVQSLLDDTRPVTDGTIAPGDILVRNDRGYEHAAMVVDLAVDRDGQIALLLAQGHTPAATLHIAKSSTGSAWHVVYRDGFIDLGPQGMMNLSSLRRWH